MYVVGSLGAANVGTLSAANEYHIYPNFLDRQAWANSVDPDQMLQNTASDQGL